MALITRWSHLESRGPVEDEFTSPLDPLGRVRAGSSAAGERWTPPATYSSVHSHELPAGMHTLTVADVQREVAAAQAELAAATAEEAAAADEAAETRQLYWSTFQDL